LAEFFSSEEVRLSYQVKENCEERRDEEIESRNDEKEVKQSQRKIKRRDCGRKFRDKGKGSKNGMMRILKRYGA